MAAAQCWSLVAPKMITIPRHQRVRLLTVPVVCLLGLVLCCSVSVSRAQTLEEDGWYYQNVAVGKPSRHIDTTPNQEAWRANDGNPSGRIDDCSATKASVDTWWVVDLLESHFIYAVKMKNRNSHTVTKLKNFYVYVSETNPLPLPPADGGNFSGEICLFHSGVLPANDIKFLPCEDGKVLRGRYVYVWKPGNTGQLYLCELEALTKYPLREFTFSMTNGVESRKEAYVVETLEETTYTQCAIFCLNLANATVETMQFDWTTGGCSCFEVTPFDDTSALDNVTAKHGVTIMQRIL